VLNIDVLFGVWDILKDVPRAKEANRRLAKLVRRSPVMFWIRRTSVMPTIEMQLPHGGEAAVRITDDGYERVKCPEDLWNFLMEEWK